MGKIRKSELVNGFIKVDYQFLMMVNCCLYKLNISRVSVHTLHISSFLSVFSEGKTPSFLYFSFLWNILFINYSVVFLMFNNMNVFLCFLLNT